ncbi:MAG: class I SAM-dependent methyltransferase [Clostridia bacterium]|nr:class I SAM-dependent methyltransferase [Clostridia bacterium]
MDIVQTFYDNLASDYDKLFADWDATTKEHALILDKIFVANGFDKSRKILDCACGIGTQAIGLAKLGYNVTASDISEAELDEAKRRAKERDAKIDFKKADFRNLSNAHSKKFDIIIAMDNALPHMLTYHDLKSAIDSIINQLESGGVFVASIRDYDSLIETKPPYSPPYIHKTQNGKRVSFQTWDWRDNHYKLTQYIIDDESDLNVNKFECEYRAFKREELTEMLLSTGCEVKWIFPDKTLFYQPIVVAKYY